MRNDWKWPLLGLAALLANAAPALAQSRVDRERVIAPAAALSHHAQEFSALAQQIPSAQPVHINARRLAESAAHVHGVLLNNPYSDLGRDYQRVALDYDYVRTDLQFLYGGRMPTPLRREWQLIRQAFEELSGGMGKRTLEPAEYRDRTSAYPAYDAPRYDTPRYRPIERD